MRRRVIAPLKRGLRAFEGRPSASLKVLDVATGTGRTLQQIRAALPEATLVGLDLSEAYLRQANRWLNQGTAHWCNCSKAMVSPSPSQTEASRP